MKSLHVIILCALVAAVCFLILQNQTLSMKLADKTARINFENQQKCAAQAEHLFLQWGYTGNDFGTIYQSNWNVALNKCFISLSSTMSSKEGMNFRKFMLDAYSQRQYAEFDGFADKEDIINKKTFGCTLTPPGEKERICKSESEYDAFILPYME